MKTTRILTVLTALLPAARAKTTVKAAETKRLKLPT